MRNKKTFISFILLLSIVVFANFTFVYKYKTAGSHPGCTGAPGDATCGKFGCHVTASFTSNDTIVNHLVFPTANRTYVPGQTYSITLQTQSLGITKFGFEIVALRDTDDTNVGQLTLTDTIRTQLIYHTVGGLDLRYSITHTTLGTPATAPNYTEWTFDWTAPASNVGPITFYCATNCTNNDGDAAGDAIYMSQFKIMPAPSSAINEYLNEANTKVYFDNSSGEIVVDYYLKSNKEVEIKIYDSLGREIRKGIKKAKSQGQQREQFLVGQSLNKGVYYVNLEIENASVSKKIVVQ